MNFYKLKLAGISLGIATAVIPPTLYKASELYIGAYQSGTSYLSGAWHAGLGMAGLTTIQPEPDIDSLIVEAATEYKLNPKLLAAVVTRESTHNSDAYSPKGAIGLAQIMPFNASRCGLAKKSKLWDDRNNIRCGARILSEELAAAKNKLPVALQVYNGGPKCVNKCKESIQYAANVISTFANLSLR